MPTTSPFSVPYKPFTEFGSQQVTNGQPQKITSVQLVTASNSWIGQNIPQVLPRWQMAATPLKEDEIVEEQQHVWEIGNEPVRITGDKIEKGEPFVDEPEIPLIIHGDVEVLKDAIRKQFGSHAKVDLATMKVLEVRPIKDEELQLMIHCPHCTGITYHWYGLKNIPSRDTTCTRCRTLLIRYCPIKKEIDDLEELNKALDELDGCEI